jgi:hypothetical protein
MRLTNELQWREAFLYKLNVQMFRSGDEATYEFDRYRRNGENNNNNNDSINDIHPNRRLEQ